MIEVSEQTIDKIHAILAGIQDADKKVLKPAMTRGLMAGKTAAGKAVRLTYHISASDFSSRGYMKYNGVSQGNGGIIGSIEYSGGVIPLMKFKVTPTIPKKNATPMAAVIKTNSLVAFDRKKDVHVLKMKSGYIGIYKGENGKLKELYSPSVPKMVGNDTVMQTVENRVNEVINQRIDHEIERLLSRNGG